MTSTRLRSNPVNEQDEPRSPLFFVLLPATSGPIPLLRRALNQPPLQRLVERRPRRAGVAVLADVAREGVQFRVEVVQVMKGDGFGRHRQLWTAEFVAAMMAD